MSQKVDFETFGKAKILYEGADNMVGSYKIDTDSIVLLVASFHRNLASDGDSSVTINASGASGTIINPTCGVYGPWAKRSATALAFCRKGDTLVVSAPTLVDANLGDGPVLGLQLPMNW